MSCERQLGDRGEDVGTRGVSSRLRKIDEYRFAVTQFGGDPLTVGRGDGAVVDHAERIAVLAVGVGEYA